MPKDILKNYFGYDDFKPGQEKIINSILKRRDALGIMPTGAGKSLCYQVPALVSQGLTIVVSPLISLMQDQVKSLKQAGVSAAYINSSLTQRQIEMALYNAAKGQYKIIYVAPERLLTDSFLEFATGVDIFMLTVDEAHCISQWGQDFRPSYAQIPTFIENLDKRPIVSAFTATATERVKDDIITQLKLQNPLVEVSGFDRENLYFEVKNSSDKLYDLLDFLNGREKESGIIYCSTRKTVENVCDHLLAKGFSAAKYHAGLPQNERSDNQNDFIYDRINIMVATNAFGMGIDKADVKYVVHYNMPKDMESYYQEAGRAGRDGSFAYCLMLYNGQDVITNQFIIEKGHEENDDIKVAQQLIANDLKRLKQITFYSTTNDCLRGFILKYFGETPELFCDNCGNCDIDFELVNATVEAQKIISCVIRTGERFGKVMIIDVLKGSKNKKVLQFNFDELSTYGISDLSENRLRVIIDSLIMSGYLAQTDSQYSVVKTTAKSKELLQDDAKFEVKFTKEEEVVRETKSAKKAKSRDLSPVMLPLFEKLRELRTEVAKIESVPAFVIFSDLTLIDMCNKLPTTHVQFSEVSGVGKQKLDKYGDAFIEVIKNYCDNNSVEAQFDVTTKKKVHKSTVVIPNEEIISEINPTDEYLPISEIAKIVNDVLEFNECTKISAVKMANYLLEKGYLTSVATGTGNTKIPSELGMEKGIIQEERIGEKGTYKVNLYPENMQEYIIDNLIAMYGER